MIKKALPLALAGGLAIAGGAQAAPVRTDGPNPSTRTIARGLDHPWEMAFLPDGSALVSERPGRLRFVTKDLELSGRVVARFGVSGGEGGLLGVAVDPRFSRNRYVYVFRTTDHRGAALVRYRLVRRRLRSRRVLFGGISVNRVHNGGRLKFGPGRRLYLTTGDSANPSTAQSSRSRNGKFLALGRSQVLGRGGRPAIVSKGHRNPQGFAFSRRGTLFATEHGSTGCDEVNVIRRGRNYGWPTIRCSASAPGLVRPLTFYPTSIAPSGATFVTQGGSAWSGDFLFGALRGQPHPPPDHQRRQRGPQTRRCSAATSAGSATWWRAPTERSTR